jgi:hypothetical protein
VGRRSTFRIRDDRARLKRVGHCYASSVLRDAEDVIRVHVARLLAVLERRRGAAVDMLLPFRMLAMDVAGKYAAFMQMLMSSPVHPRALFLTL